MIKENIFLPLDKEIRLKYSGVAEVARKIGITRQALKMTLDKLENNSSVTLKTLEKICDGLNYEIVVRKKEEKNTAK